jgi:hypothetical protein
MGQQVAASGLALGRADEVRRRLDRSVAVLRRMVSEGRFVGHEDTIGMEVELDLVDPLGRPRLVSEAVLARLDRPDFQSELGKFNLEVNLPPRPLRGPVLRWYERQLASILGPDSDPCAGPEQLGARLIAIGTLPTLRADQLTADGLSANPRYALLDEQMHAARGRPVTVLLPGVEPLSFAADSVAPEASATSLQLHLRVRPERFAAFYNAAQLIAAAQVAVGANAPYVLGRQLWQESRIALCEQLLDTRRWDEVSAGAPPRVWFGDHWVGDAVELFDQIVRSFPPLLPILDAEEPDAGRSGPAPRLPELCLHNGTVWRWNRPVYDVQDGRPQLRIENRVLPSGPTAIDMTANAAFYFGLVRAVADSDPPGWARHRFALAEQDLRRAARDGLDAELRWRGQASRAADLIRAELLPLAAAGLDAWGIDAADRDRYLGVIDARAAAGRTGAGWQIAAVSYLEAERGMSRPAALREMTRRYVEHAHHGAPVHLWPVP